MQKADNLIRCQIAAQYSDDNGYMFVPGHFEGLEFHPIWEKAVKADTAPEGWFCVGVFGSDDTNKMVEMAVGAGAGVRRSLKGYSN